jgi:DNA-binding Lrp family transcriptional regulator
MKAHYALDRIDVKILAELQANGRISNVELAERVHLSPSPCLARVKKLQDSGYILGYCARINAAKLGKSMTVFTEVTLKSHHHSEFARFQDAVKKVENCIECHIVSGGYDYLLKFVTPGIAEYQTIMENLVEKDVGIDLYFSFIVISSPFSKQNEPLLNLFSERL